MARWHSRVDPPHAAADTIDRINLKSMWLWPLVTPKPRSDRSLQRWSHSVARWWEEPAEWDEWIHNFPLGSVESTQPKCPCIELLHIWWRHQSSRAWFSKYSLQKQTERGIRSIRNGRRSSITSREMDGMSGAKSISATAEISSSLMFG